MTLMTHARLATRSLALLLGVAMAFAPATGAFAAESSTQDSLCDAIDLEALNALGPQYETPTFGSPELCAYQTASGDATLTIVISGISFDLVQASAPEGSDTVVADRPAVAVDGALHIDIGEGTLSIAPDLSGDAADIDPIEYASSVGELVLPSVEATATGNEPAASGGPSATAPEVPGIEWGRSQTVTTVAELTDADEGQLATWQPLLDASGADPTQVSILSANATDAQSGEMLGNYSTIRIEGVDESVLVPAVVEWMRSVSEGDKVTVEDGSIGGKDVVTISVGGEFRGYLYAKGDTVHALAMTEEAASRILGVLP
jgi:hypothetical protein